MVSLNTIPCPTCPSHPSIPRDILGHQGTSHGVPQRNSLSHLSIPSLSPQGTYWDIKGCPMVSLSTVLCPTCPSHPSVPNGIWDIMGHPMVSLSTILCPTCLSIEFLCTILYFIMINITYP